MRTRSSSRGATLLLAAALLLGPPLARAQENDFFEQAPEYFKTESVEGVSKHAEAPTETPATVTVVTRDDIEHYGFRTLADVLNFASMGNVALVDRRWDVVGSRGLFLFEDFNTRILVMLDGHSINEPWSNFAEIGRAMLVPLELVERIEIIYGPSSLLYGGYSLYGIVNVITRPASALSGARLNVSGGNWSTGEAVASWARVGSYGGEEGGREWSVVAAAGYYSSEGEDLDLPREDVGYAVALDGSTVWGGPQSGTDFERAPFAFLKVKRGDLTLLARGGYRKRGAPFAPYGALYGRTDQYLRDEKEFAELRWERALSPGLTLYVRGFHDYYRYEEQDPYADDVTYPGQRGYRFVLRTHDHDTGGEARFNYRRGTHFVTVGGEYRYRTFASESRNRFFDGTAAPDAAARQSVTGKFGVLYAQEEWRPLQQLSLIAGGNFAHTDPGGSKAQPRLAVVYKPRRQLSIKALYGRGFRPPSVLEATYADYLAYVPNPSLESEEIESEELSVIWQPGKRVSTQAYVFHSVLTGLIQGVTLESAEDVQGGVVGPGGTADELVGMLQYQGTGEVRSSGAGVSLRVQGRRLQGYANLAYARARRPLTDAGCDGGAPPDGENCRLPASPRWLSSFGVSWNERDWSLGLSARYAGPTRLDPSRFPNQAGPEDTAGDYFEANLRGLYRTRLVYPVTLHLDVLNLFGTEGSEAASPVYAPARLPIPGRRLVLGAEVRF